MQNKIQNNSVVSTATSENDDERSSNAMLTRKETQNLPALLRQAEFRPNSVSEEQRTVEVTFSTGARVKRFGMFDDFIEELSMEPKSIRLQRLNNGAPLLNNHRGHDLDDVLGVVERARIKDGVGIATVRFSKNERGEKVFQDVKDGILRNISVGYRVHEFEEAGREGDVRIFRAVDWEPMELSLVTIPADPGAQVRNSEDVFPCNIVLRKETTMTRQNPEVQSPAPVKESSGSNGAEAVEAARQAAIKEERERVTSIRSAAVGLGVSEDFTNDLIAKGVTLSDARAALIDEKVKLDKKADTKGQNVQVTRDQMETMHRGIEEAILHRVDSHKNKLTDLGREFRGLSFARMAALFLEQKGVNTSRMSNDDIWYKTIETRSLHSTSDFPLLLENVLNKTLRLAYEASPAVWMPITRQVEVPDFKQISRAQLGDAPALVELAESGEIQAGTIGEGSEKYNVKTFARKVRISRKALVNDDLSAFSRLPEMFGRRARDLENNLIWNSIILANYVMGDAIALFNASHNNLIGGALSLTSLSAGRAAMRKQKSITANNDEMPIFVTPRYLIVPPELETTADQLVAQVTADQAANVNVFSGRLQVLVEPRLSDSSIAGSSTTAWYLAADVGQIDILEMARLTGQDGPNIQSQELFDMEGMQVKASYDVGVAPIDFRGLVKSTGV